jgi:hypothetical protein
VLIKDLVLQHEILEGLREAVFIAEASYLFALVRIKATE